MNASSTIGALSSYVGAASCASDTAASCAARPWVAAAFPVEAACTVDAAADAGAAMPVAAAATPATVAAAAAACPASADCAPPSFAHCAVLASIERSVSCTLGAGAIGAAGFSVQA
nr:hypothetical protein [Burkholderia cepacia]